MTRTITEDLLVSGLVDWASAGWVLGCAFDASTDPQVRRQVAIGVIAEVLVQGLMVAGDVGPNGFTPWGTGAGTSLETIVAAWVRDSPLTGPGLGEIVWLANTERGDRVARAVLAAEAADDPGAGRPRDPGPGR